MRVPMCGGCDGQIRQHVQSITWPAVENDTD
jgi:hypothetical protein